MQEREEACEGGRDGKCMESMQKRKTTHKKEQTRENMNW